MALSVDEEAVRARIQSARQMLTTFVPPLTVVPVSLLLPSMRKLRLLHRMLSDWPVVTLSRVTSPRALSSTLPALTIWAPVAWMLPPAQTARAAKLRNWTSFIFLYQTEYGL